MSENTNEFPVDFVVTWVDGSDNEWLEKRKKYSKDNLDKSQNENNRYRDYGLLPNVFDRIWKFAPWVNKVYLVTDNQAPSWAVRDERIVTVNHEDFIPSRYLPVFNSNAIEMNLWRIEGLSENFVLFNDDMFITSQVSKNDFFGTDGNPVLCGALDTVSPRDEFSKIIFNNAVMLNAISEKRDSFKNSIFKYLSIRYGAKTIAKSILASLYPKWMGFFEDHLAYPHLKSTFSRLYCSHPEVFQVTSSNRFRSSSDYSHWLIKNINLVEGNFHPRRENFGLQLGIESLSSLEQVKEAVSKYKVIVINDAFKDEDADLIIKRMNNMMKNF